ncbi:hypothetical protein Tco_0311901 [Tanacetum coccineum]
MLHVPPENNEFEGEIIPCSDFRTEYWRLVIPGITVAFGDRQIDTEHLLGLSDRVKGSVIEWQWSTSSCSRGMDTHMVSNYYTEDFVIVEQSVLVGQNNERGVIGNYRYGFDDNREDE